MKLYCLVSAALLALQGCSDDGDKDKDSHDDDHGHGHDDEDPTTTTTTAGPTCGKVTPKGYMTIETQEAYGGVMLSKTTCDFYADYNTYMLQNPVAKFNVFNIIGLFEHYDKNAVSVVKGDSALNRDRLRAHVKEEGASSPLLSRISEGISALKLDEVAKAFAAELLELKMKEFDEKPSSEIANMLFEAISEKEEDALGVLTHALFLDMRIEELVFNECNDLLGFIGGTFLIHGFDVDGFCDASRPPRSGECELSGKGSNTMLSYGDAGWSVDMLKCDGTDHPKIIHHLQEVFAWFEKGDYVGDATIHYSSCEQLQGEGGQWVNDIADLTCFVHPPPCTKTSPGGTFEIELEWNPDRAEDILKGPKTNSELDSINKDVEKDLEKLGTEEGVDTAELDKLTKELTEAIPEAPTDEGKIEGELEEAGALLGELEGDLEKALADAKENLSEEDLKKLTDYEKDGYEDKKGFGIKAYEVTKTRCDAHPTFSDDISSFLTAKPEYSGFESCDDAMKMVMKSLGGWQLDTFCDPAYAPPARNETCVMGSGDGDMFQLNWVNATWTFGSAMCNGVESAPAADAVKSKLDHFSKYGPTFAAALSNMDCSMLGGAFESTMEKIDGICAESAADSATTAAPTTTAGAALLM